MVPLALTLGLFWLALFHVLPAVLVLNSQRSPIKDRNLWAVGVLFTSWLGFIAFMVVTTMEPLQPTRDAVAERLRQSRGSVLDSSEHQPR